MQRALEEAFGKLQADIALRIYHGQAVDYDELTNAFRGILEAELVEIATEEGIRLGSTIGFDPAAINAQAVDWARSYSFELVKDLTETSREVISRSIQSFFSTPGMTRGDLIRLLDPAFGRVRAEMIAVTETTRAFSQAQNAYQRQLSEEGVEMERVWRTSNDELVCFPATTLVATPNGYTDIASLQVGDIVQSVSGPRKVLAINKRDYAGRLVTVKAGEHWVTATEGHPFWVLDKGWLEAGQIEIGNQIELIGNEIAQVDGLFHFSFAKPQNVPASTFKETRLACVSGGVLVPIAAINLYSDSILGKGKVYGVAPDAAFLLKVEAEASQCLADFGLQQRFGLGATIASKATELAVAISRLRSKYLATRWARQSLSRAATFLAAIMPIESLLGNKHLTATLANGIFSIGQSTFDTANGITMGDGGVDSKGLLANRADPTDFGSGGHTATRGTKSLIAGSTLGGEVKSHVADRADTIFPAPTTLGGFDLHNVMADWHDTTALYHGWCASVYNLQVEECQTFYANGILVHNCPICAPLNGLPEEDWKGTYPEGPAAHPRCRCSMTLRIPVNA